MATRRYDVGGGTLNITDPDPLKVALAQAQLANLQGTSAPEQAKLEAQRQETARMWATLLQQGQIARGQQTEENRYHTGTLEESRRARGAQTQVEQAKLAEDLRYHTGVLGESQADREQKAELARNALKAGQIGDIIHSLGPQLSTEPGKLAAVLSAYGDPAYGQAEKAFNEAQAKQKGEQIAANVGKGGKPEQLSALLTGQNDPNLVNAAWNAYKAANPDVLGPPPPAATTTTATAAPTPPAQVRTDRGLVNPSMGLVENGRVLPIPGSTPGIDYTGGTAPTVATTTPNVAALTKAVAANVPTNELMTPTPAPTPLTGGGSSFGAPEVNVDQLLQNVVGGPTAEDLRRRRLSQQPVAPTLRY